MGIPRSTFYDAPAVATSDSEILASITSICDECGKNLVLHAALDDLGQPAHHPFAGKCDPLNHLPARCRDQRGARRLLGGSSSQHLLQLGDPGLDRRLLSQARGVLGTLNLGRLPKTGARIGRGLAVALCAGPNRSVQEQ